jgi:membrane fusion protein (multidrug efflux system)
VRYAITIAAVTLLLLALAGMKAAEIAVLVRHGEKQAKEGPPPETVATFVAQEQEWERTLTAVGSVASAKGVTVGTEAAGKVTRIAFESGAMARRGDVLVELDTAVERAQLESAIARRDLARLTMARTKALAASGSVSTSELDNARAQLDSSEKDVEALRATIERRVVVAPFSGRLGIRSVNLGQYVNVGTPVTVLETIKEVFADFTVPQQHLSELRIDTPVQVTAVRGAGAPRTGAIAAVDPSVDPTTRHVKVRATIPNEDEALRSGMFVDVTVVFPERLKVVAVPAQAIVHAPFGDSVFLVENGVARQQFVRTGRARGDFVAIEAGLTPGQRVVTAGAFKVRTGSRVTIDDAMQKTPSLAPTPENR